MTICLIRHGQTDWNIHTLLQGRTDVPLNEVGKSQAKAVGAYLKANDPHWDRILSSPLGRALETAKIIAQEIGFTKEIGVVPEAIERNFGSLEGQHLDSKMYDLLERGHPEVEKMEHLYARARKALEDIALKHPGERVILVSHAQFIKAALAAADPDFDFRFPLKNSSLNYLEAEDGGFRILKFNVVPE